jgi:hypothetical protein
MDWRWIILVAHHLGGVPRANEPVIFRKRETNSVQFGCFAGSKFAATSVPRHKSNR